MFKHFQYPFESIHNARRKTYKIPNNKKDNNNNYNNKNDDDKLDKLEKRESVECHDPLCPQGDSI